MAWEFDCNTAPTDGASWDVQSAFGSAPEISSDGSVVRADPDFQEVWVVRVDEAATGDDQFIEFTVTAQGDITASVLKTTGSPALTSGYTWQFLGGGIRRWNDTGYNGDTSYTYPAVPYVARFESVGGVQKVYIDSVEVDSWTDDTPLTNSGSRSYQGFGLTGATRIDDVSAGDIGGGAPTEPAQVTGLDTIAGETEVDLEWIAPANGGDPITDYVIQWAPDSSGSPGSWTTITDGTSTAITYTDTGLTVDTIYWYRVAAVNGIGQGVYSDPVSATTSVSAIVGIWEDATPPLATLDPDDPSVGSNYGFQSVTAGQDGTIYAVEDYHGLFRSTDGCSTWEGPFVIGATPGTCWTIQVDPFNADVVWANSGYGDGGPLKSTDQGDSWTKKAVGAPTQVDDIYCIALDPYLADHVLVGWHYVWSTGPASGISESFDGGDTWANHAPERDEWGSGHAIFFLDDSETWLIATQNDGVWRTTDSGVSWTQVIVEPMCHGATDCLTRVGTTLFIALEHSVMQSDDWGLTWDDISTGLSGDSFSNVATDGFNLYTAPSFPSLPDYAAADGPWLTRPIAGGSWTDMTESPNPVHAGSSNGPRQSVLTDDYVITSNYTAGIWRMALQSDVATTKFFQFL